MLSVSSQKRVYNENVDETNETQREGQVQNSGLIEENEKSIEDSDVMKNENDERKQNFSKRWLKLKWKFQKLSRIFSKWWTSHTWCCSAEITLFLVLTRDLISYQTFTYRNDPIFILTKPRQISTQMISLCFLFKLFVSWICRFRWDEIFDITREIVSVAHFRISKSNWVGSRTSFPEFSTTWVSTPLLTQNQPLQSERPSTKFSYNLHQYISVHSFLWN